MKWLHIVAPTAATLAVFALLALTQDDPWGDDLPTIIQASGTVALLGVTASYVVATWEQANISRRQFEHVALQHAREVAVRIHQNTDGVHALVMLLSGDLLDPARVASHPVDAMGNGNKGLRELSALKRDMTAFLPTTTMEECKPAWDVLDSLYRAHYCLVLAVHSSRTLRDDGKHVLDRKRLEVEYAGLAKSFGDDGALVPEFDSANYTTLVFRSLEAVKQIEDACLRLLKPATLN